MAISVISKRISGAALATLTLTALGLSACSRPAAMPMVNAPAPQTMAQQAVAQAAVQSEAFFPYQVGQTLNYAIRLSPTNDPLVVEEAEYTLTVEEVTPGPQGQQIIFRASSSFGGKYQYPGLVETAQGVRLTDATFLGLGADEVKGLSIDFLHKNLQVGQRWEDENWIATVKARESVTVPAGTFNAWKISVIGTFEQAYTAVGDYWFVPGVGMVKSDLSQPGWHMTSLLK